MKKLNYLGKVKKVTLNRGYTSYALKTDNTFVEFCAKDEKQKVLFDGLDDVINYIVVRKLFCHDIYFLYVDGTVKFSKRNLDDECLQIKIFADIDAKSILLRFCTLHIITHHGNVYKMTHDMIIVYDCDITGEKAETVFYVDDETIIITEQDNFYTPITYKKALEYIHHAIQFSNYNKFKHTYYLDTSGYVYEYNIFSSIKYGINDHMTKVRSMKRSISGELCLLDYDGSLWLVKDNHKFVKVDGLPTIKSFADKVIKSLPTVNKSARKI